MNHGNVPNHINALRPKQNDCLLRQHFEINFFSGPIDNKPALVLIIALNKDCLNFLHMYASLDLDGFSNTDGEEIVDYCPFC